MLHILVIIMNSWLIIINYYYYNEDSDGMNDADDGRQEYYVEQDWILVKRNKFLLSSEQSALPINTAFSSYSQQDKR